MLPSYLVPAAATAVKPLQLRSFQPALVSAQGGTVRFFNRAAATRSPMLH